MKCVDCPYFWNDHDFDPNADDISICHYTDNDGCAPCEVSDKEAL